MVHGRKHENFIHKGLSVGSILVGSIDKSLVWLIGDVWHIAVAHFCWGLAHKMAHRLPKLLLLLIAFLAGESMFRCLAAGSLLFSFLVLAVVSPVPFGFDKYPPLGLPV